MAGSERDVYSEDETKDQPTEANEIVNPTMQQLKRAGDRAMAGVGVNLEDS